MLALGLLTGVGTRVPAAQAAPAVPVAAAPADDDTRDDDRPVLIRVGRFEPRTVTPGATVSVTGTLVNTGATAITDLQVRLQRGDVVTTRAELTALVQDPDPATTVEPPFVDVPGELAPGGQLDFSYTVASEALRLTQDGVYPVLINVNGAVDGNDQRRVGELPTYVVQQPVLPASQTAVAWLWPLVERTHRSPSGRFADDDLTEAVDEGGRLDRALAVVERLPDTRDPGAPGAPAAVPALQVTLAVDPALVEELQLMAAGPYEVGEDGTGRGTDAAAAFLDRLSAVADVHPIVALPYGDVDADALQASGLPEVLTRSLPGTPAGTAQDPPGSGDPDPAAGTSAPVGEPGTPEPESDVGAGAEILADALGADPRTDLAWAAGGSLRNDTLGVLQAGGVRDVVLGTAGLTQGDGAVGLTGAVAAARTTIEAPGGTMGALVADPTLGDIVGAAEQAPGGARMAEQRYLAELAVIALQAPAGTEQTVLVAPPRTVEAGPEGAGAMMADSTALPWLRAATLDELTAGAAVPAGDLQDPVDVVRLDAAGLAAVTEGVAVRDGMAAAVDGDADVALRSQDAAVSRTTSVVWRTDPEGFRAAAETLQTTLDRLRSRVTLLAPADGTYSLASSDAPLVLTVRNDLPVAVEVQLVVRTRGSRGLSIGDIGTQTLAPGERTTLQVPTEVHQSGGFGVTAQLTTPGGLPLGDEVQLQVKSTAYGSISLLITIGAAGLLGLLFLRRLINLVLRRRRAARDTGPDVGAPEGAAQQPPHRSPV